MRRLAAIATILWLLTPLSARADGIASAPVTPATLWYAWNWDLLILLNLALLGVGYVAGLRQLQRRAGITHRIRGGQIAYLISLGLLFVALISPLHALSEELASAHMVQHMLLMVVAAPLFVLGSPGQVLIWCVPSEWRPAIARGSRSLIVPALHQPLLPWVLHAAALWFWHWPAAYQAALFDPLVHDAQHLCFFIVASLYWRGLLAPLRRRQLQPLTAVGSLFATSLQAMLLGIFLALSPEIWYAAYHWRTAAWGLTPLEDQQLAGFIMWMPACLVYPALAAVILGRWLQTMSRLPPRQHPLQEI